MGRTDLGSLWDIVTGLLECVGHHWTFQNALAEPHRGVSGSPETPRISLSVHIFVQREGRSGYSKDLIPGRFLDQM